MKSTIYVLLLTLPFCMNVIAAEKLNLNYHYQGTYPADFSGMPDGPLQIGRFEDIRNVSDPAIIQVGDQEYMLDRSLGEYINAAFTQALSRANASISAHSTTLISGRIIEFSADFTDTGIEVLLRCDTILNTGYRNAWQSTLFSRVETPTNDVAEAVGAALDRLARELLVDDYFRMELGLF